MDYFNELKETCKEVWGKYKDRPGDYYEEKIKMVNRVKKELDAFILVNMFDSHNQLELWLKLSEGCKEHYRDLFDEYLWSSGVIESDIMARKFDD